MAIEIAHNGHVNREAVLQDFAARSLPPPAAILRGDCLEAATRARAREAIGGGPFDIIVTDPPYGIREALEEAHGQPARGGLAAQDRRGQLPVVADEDDLRARARAGDGHEARGLRRLGRLVQ